jgi:hypothetical protein
LVFAALVACAVAPIGCSAIVDLSGLAGNGATEGGADAMPGGDASVLPDGNVVVVSDGGDGSGGDAMNPLSEGGLASHDIATVGSVPAVTGNAQQQQIVFATASGRYWFFFLNDTNATSIEASWSFDMITWNAAASRPLSEGMAFEGRNFSVSYANIAGLDVVHSLNAHFLIPMGAEDVRHGRATISGPTINYEPGTSETAVSPYDMTVNPDGCVSTIASDGNVYDATSWYEGPDGGPSSIGAMTQFRSTITDVGSASAWSGSMTPNLSYASLGVSIHNRLLVPLSAGGVLRLWVSGRTQPNTDNLEWSSTASTAAVPTAAADLFPSAPSAVAAPNDWSACTMGSTAVHVVRRRLDGTANDAFDHYVFNGTTWSAGATIPNDAGKQGSGVVLLTNGTTMLLFAIASDAANSIRFTRFDNNAWSPWSTLVSTSATRNYLSGSGARPSTRGGIVWTEGAAAPYKAVGVAIDSLF